MVPAVMVVGMDPRIGFTKKPCRREIALEKRGCGYGGPSTYARCIISILLEILTGQESAIVKPIQGVCHGIPRVHTEVRAHMTQVTM